MGDRRQLTFYIYLTDAKRVADLNAQYPRGVERGPVPASQEFNAPWIPPGGTLTYPCTNAPMLQWGGDITRFPTDRAVFTLDDNLWGQIKHLFGGGTQQYLWVGVFRYMAPKNEEPPWVPPTVLPGNPPPVKPPPDPDPAKNIPGSLRPVAFAVGFETGFATSNSGGEGQEATGIPHMRGAARTPEGFGGACRNDIGTQERIRWDKGGLTPNNRGWERFYIRVTTRPSINANVWRMRYGNGNIGVIVQMTPAGALEPHYVDDFGQMREAMGISSPLPNDGRWHCIDFVYSNGVQPPASPAPPAKHVISFDIFCDHAQIGAIAAFGTGHPRAAHKIDSSGLILGPTGTGAEIDFDDHIGFMLPDQTVAQQGLNEYWGGDNMALPVGDNPKLGRDWANGHRIVYLEPQAFEATPTGWTGDVRTLTQRGVIGANTEVAMQSSVSGAEVRVTTIADLKANQHGSIGWQAFTVAVMADRGGGAHGSLGYTLQYKNDPEAVVQTIDVLKTLDQPGANSWNTIMGGLPSFRKDPPVLVSLTLKYRKAADTTANTVRGLGATLVLFGNWDSCDYGQIFDDETKPHPTLRDPMLLGHHNSPYPLSLWADPAVPPDSPGWVKADTYIGNNFGQDVIARVPAHFWWVRCLSSPFGSVRWWSTMVSSHWGLEQVPRGGMNYAQEDPFFVPTGAEDTPEVRAMLRIGGAAEQDNRNTFVYQYLAFSDPGQRWMLNDDRYHSTVQSSAVNTLVDNRFLPEWLFAVVESTTPGTNAFYLKGPGHPAQVGNRLDLTAEQLTVGEWALGSFTSRVSLHLPGGSGYGAALNFWRMVDITDEQYAALDLPVAMPVQILSYVGNGAAVRLIALPRASGTRPMWALVQGRTGFAYVRDPSHTTTQSSTAGAGSSVVLDAITGGGIDTVLVGATVNVTGITYNLFVIMGCAEDTGNNGWSHNCEVYYEPIPAPGGQWPGPHIPTPGAECLDVFPLLPPEACMDASTFVVNMALGEIGITKQISKLADDPSQEGVLARLVFSDVLDTVLRDFPWRFATEYADLEWIAGTPTAPVNADWRYSFTLPIDCVRVRRVCDPSQQRRYSVTPVPFDVRADAVNLDILLCNEPGGGLLPPPAKGVDPVVTIEYTKRSGCPAQVNDAQFREALVYKLAARLAKGLARDSADADRCLRNYMQALPKAQTQHANTGEPQRPVDGNPDWLTGR